MEETISKHSKRVLVDVGYGVIIVEVVKAHALQQALQERLQAEGWKLVEGSEAVRSEERVS